MAEAGFPAGRHRVLDRCLSTFAPPESEEAWRTLWCAPPNVAVLDDAFAPYAHAFDLDGDGPRFMQDFDPLSEGAKNGVDALLIEAPGAQTERNNADLIVKRGRIARLARPTAAMALFTLQTYAPSGGAGHRVGLRGGGPLTTLVVPEEGNKPRRLWHLVWAHVAQGKRAISLPWPRYYLGLRRRPLRRTDAPRASRGCCPCTCFGGCRVVSGSISWRTKPRSPAT